MPRMQSTATSSFPWINADCCQASCRRRSEVIIECIRRRNTHIMRARIILLSVLLVCTSIRYAEGRTKKTQLSLQSKETNVVNFMRLLVMRLIFGVASAMGLGENLSGVLGGIFVPPGAEDYNDDYGDDDDLTSDLGVF